MTETPYLQHLTKSARIAARVGAVALAAALVWGCSRSDTPDGGAPAASNSAAGAPAGDAPAPGGTSFEQAQALLDRGDIPAAVEPLRKAVREAGKSSPLPREEIEFLLTQAEAASKEETVEARLGDMREATFETFVATGQLPRVPYFHDPRIDAYFRTRLAARRAEAREIRTRIRGR